MPAAKPTVEVKRVYDTPSESDGTRVLVDRLWPRGLTKDEARVDAWVRDLAPSNELRKWAHAHTDERQEFRRRYIRELHAAAASEALNELQALVRQSRKVTLLFASKNIEYNNATVLKDFLAKSQTAGKPRAHHF